MVVTRASGSGEHRQQGEAPGASAHGAPLPPELATLVTQQAQLIRLMQEEAREQREER